jgi:hypothetical protein
MKRAHGRKRSHRRKGGDWLSDLAGTASKYAGKAASAALPYVQQGFDYVVNNPQEALAKAKQGYDMAQQGYDMYNKYSGKGYGRTRMGSGPRKDLPKGSPQAKAYMAKLRAMRKGGPRRKRSPLSRISTKLFR